MNKEIRNYNDKYQEHGYQQWCGITNKLQFRGYCKNDNRINYVELHYFKQTLYYII